MKNPWTLKNEARDEAYIYFDKEIRSLTKNSVGNIDPFAKGLENNDIDAFRHAYVSGVFTQEYSESAADIFGRMNEMNPIGQSQPNDPAATNMDLWNNAVGRKYGSKAKGRKSLLKMIHKALDGGELIITPKDKRHYEGAAHNPVNKTKPVIVLQESKKGRNEIFFDTEKKTILTAGEFVALIESGQYPGYTVKIIKGIATPVSIPDSREANNLG